MSDPSDNSSRRSWIGLLANLGVITGLVFLAVELRQNTNMMEAQINQDRTDTALSFQQANYNQEFMPPILVKVENGESLSREEMRRYESYFRGFNRNMDNQLWQYRQGFLGENIPRSVRFAVQGVIGGSRMSVDLWEQTKQGYTDDYIAFVDEAIADLSTEQ